MENTNSYKTLFNRLWKLMETEHYSVSTAKDMRFILDSFSAFMETNCMSDYSPEIGMQFITYCRDELHVCSSRVSRAKGIVGKLNRLMLGYEGRAALWSYHVPKIVLPLNYQKVLEHYLSFCTDNGNRETTLQYKNWICTRFLNGLVELGCNDISELSGEFVQKAFLLLGYMRYWERIGPFLRFLYQNNLVSSDYSKIVLYHKKHECYSVKYTPDEISKIEASIDLTVPNGIRDFAIILLLSRYGIRSCDIASLTFENVDFDSNRISFIQQKTGVPWEAELLPEVKSALYDYISSVRPKETNHDQIFLTLKIPIKPIDYRIINTMVGNRIKESTVNINGRKHGSRSFRSSIASNMINDSVSTEVVRKVLGHGTKYALTHYVKIDIESMRICPLPVQKPSGRFAELLCLKEDESYV